MFSTNTRPASFLAIAACLLVLLLPACASSEAASSSLVLTGEFEFDPSACCSTSVTTDDAEYLYAMTLGGEDEPLELDVLAVSAEGVPEEQATLNAPIDVVFGDFVGIMGMVSPAVMNDRLYMPVSAEDQSGIWVLDISDPASPEEVDFVETDFIPTSMSISGSTAAVATMSFDTVALFDLSNPDQPQFVTTVKYSGRSMPEVELVDDALYIYSISGVGIFDVSDVTASQQIGSVDPPILGAEEPDLLSGEGSSGIFTIEPDEQATKQVSGIAVAGNDYLYGVAGAAGLSVVDISDPGNTERVANMEFDLPAWEVAIEGDRLYVLTAGEPIVGKSISEIPHRFHVVDVSDPTEPETIDTVEDIPGGLPHRGTLIPGDEYIYIVNDSAVHVLGESE